MKNGRTFWDLCAKFHDIAENTNAFNTMLATVRDLVPQGASVLEAASGTGTISAAVADKAGRVLCMGIKENTIKIAHHNTAEFANVTVENLSIHDLGEPDNAFDAVITGQVLHFVGEPQKAAAELRRVAKSMVVLPMNLTKNLRGMAKLCVSLCRFFGITPNREFDADSYAAFLSEIGFDDCEHIQIDGKIPMAVAVWRKGSGNVNGGNGI